MDYGYSFALDEQASRLNEGIAVFKYLPVYVREKIAGEIPQHPIFLLVSRNKVSFYEHYYLNGEHVETVLLDIPFFKDGEECTLQNVFKTPFNYRDRDENLETDDDKRSPFSSLSIFKDKSDDNDSFIRKLLLDFIFDLSHSSVFKHSIYYEEMKNALLSEYYFNAILRKADFYYYKSRINEIKDDKSKQMELEILFAFFSKSEADWIDCILDSRSEQMFLLLGNVYGREDRRNINWFQHPEKELRDVYYGEESVKSKKKGVKINNIVDIFNLTIKNALSQTKSLRKEFGASSEWCLQRYDLRTIMSAKTWNHFFGQLVLFCVGMVVSTFCPQFELLPIIVGFSILLSLFWCLLIRPICCVVGRNKASYHLLHISSLLPRLAAAIAAAWVSIIFSNNLITAFFDISLQHNALFKWLCIIVFIVIIYVFLFVAIDKRIPYEKRIVKIGRAAMIFLIGFFYANLFGLFFVYLTGDRMIVRSGILGEYKESVDSSVISKDVSDSTIVVCHSQNEKHNVSFYVRESDIYEGHNYLKQISNDGVHVFRTIFGIDILWNFMFFSSFLAMFIGIFLELIFHEKSITTPI